MPAALQSDGKCVLALVTFPHHLGFVRVFYFSWPGHPLRASWLAGGGGGRSGHRVVSSQAAPLPAARSSLSAFIRPRPAAWGWWLGKEMDRLSLLASCALPGSWERTSAVGEGGVQGGGEREGEGLSAHCGATLLSQLPGSFRPKWVKKKPGEGRARNPGRVEFQEWQVPANSSPAAGGRGLGPGQIALFIWLLCLWCLLVGLLPPPPL